MQVHPGELNTVMYEFQNVQNRRMAAQAIPSYAPQQAAPYFNKLECFCFNQYTLDAGREEAVAGGLRDRSEDLEGREDHHAVVHLLRGRRQDAARAVAADAPRPAARSRARDRPMTPPRKGSLWRTVKAVGWGFFGVRKNSDYQEDIAKLTPLHIIAVGLVAVVLFVVGLIAAGQLRGRALKRHPIDLNREKKART